MGLVQLSPNATIEGGPSHTPPAAQEPVLASPQPHQDASQLVWYGGSRGVWKERRIRSLLP